MLQAEGWDGGDPRSTWEIEEERRKAKREQERDDEIARLRREVDKLKRKRN